jgi:hypothetical protein
MSSQFLQRCVHVPSVRGVLAIALLVGAVVVAAPEAQAAPATPEGNGWTLYNTGGSRSANMTACKDAGNQTCVGLQLGGVLGHADLLVTVDELDQLLKLPYNDHATVPAPEGVNNKIVEIANHTAAPVFVWAGPPSAESADAAAGTLKFEPANSDTLVTAFDGNANLAFQEYAPGPSPSTLTAISGYDNGSPTNYPATSY